MISYLRYLSKHIVSYVSYIIFFKIFTKSQTICQKFQQLPTFNDVSLTTFSKSYHVSHTNCSALTRSSYNVCRTILQVKGVRRKMVIEKWTRRVPIEREWRAAELEVDGEERKEGKNRLGCDYGLTGGGGRSTTLFHRRRVLMRYTIACRLLNKKYESKMAAFAAIRHREAWFVPN